MNFFSKNKKESDKATLEKASPTPVVSERTKKSAGILKKSLSKISELIKSTPTGSKLSNTEYLGEIYKLMVVKRESEKLAREKQVNRRKEEAYEEERRHKEIIKALSVRRRKPKKVRAKQPPQAGGTPSIPPGLPLPKGTPKPPKAEIPKPKNNPADDAAEIAKREAERKAIQEAERKAAQEAERKAAEEARKKAELEAERKAAEEAARKRAQKEAEEAAEAARKKAEREAAEAAEAARKKAQREAEEAAAEAARKKAEKEAREAATEEARKKAQKEAEEAAAEVARKKAQREAEEAAAEAARKKAQREAEEAAAEAARKKAAEEAKRKAEKEAREAEQNAADNAAKRQRELQERQKKPPEEPAPPKPQDRAERLPPGPRNRTDPTADRVRMLPAPPFFSDVIQAEQNIKSPEQAVKPHEPRPYVPKRGLTEDQQQKKKEEHEKKERERIKRIESMERGGAGLRPGTPPVGASTMDTHFKDEGQLTPTRSYGLFGINNKRRYNKDNKVVVPSVLDQFITDNPQFKLPDPGGPNEPEQVKKFNEAWWDLATEKPEELYNAQVEFYRKGYNNPANERLKREQKKKRGPENIQDDPGAQYYLTDRKVNYGATQEQSALDAAAGAETAKEYLDALAYHDLSRLRFIYPSKSDAEFASEERGLKKRIIERLRTAYKYNGLTFEDGQEDTLKAIDSKPAWETYLEEKKKKEEEKKKKAEEEKRLKEENKKNKGKKISGLSIDNDSILRALQDNFGNRYGMNRITNINIIQEEEPELLTVDDRPAFLRKNTYG